MSPTTVAQHQDSTAMDPEQPKTITQHAQPEIAVVTSSNSSAETSAIKLAVKPKQPATTTAEATKPANTLVESPKDPELDLFADMEPPVGVRSSTKKSSKKPPSTTSTNSGSGRNANAVDHDAKQVAVSTKFSAAIAFEDSAGWGDDDVDITDIHTDAGVQDKAADHFAPKPTFSASVAESGWTNDGWDADTASDVTSTIAIKPPKSKLTPAPVVSSDLVNAVAASGWGQEKSDESSTDRTHSHEHAAPSSFVAAVSDSGWGNDGWDADETSQSQSISDSSLSKDKKASKPLSLAAKPSSPKPDLKSHDHDVSSKLVQDFAAAVAFEDSSGWNDAAWDGEDQAEASDTQHEAKVQVNTDRPTTASSKASSKAADDGDEGDWDAWE